MRDFELLPAALLGCAPSHFVAHPVEMRAALAMVQDASDVLSRLLAGGRNIGRVQVADAIVATMQAAGYAVNENAPFEDGAPYCSARAKRRPTSTGCA
jgi:hypothetical protein